MPNHPPFSCPLIANDADELLEACCVYLEHCATSKATFGVEAAIAVSLRHYQQWRHERTVQDRGDE